ncbi:prenyltransferase/squalene oxidase repeat-containing protein [Rubritalea marina]|uniref:prenyltransferase/squalene oxidase repeat-containing protein n=1 Tax=Rubritalea marina TaxID=361055 RepID=UPI000372385B|nr:prenyltransferase/squalene oxidase repeat-containing protein [Rubritalea marina]
MRLLPLTLAVTSILGLLPSTQAANTHYGKEVPVKVESMYQRGLKYLASSQLSNGCWDDSSGHLPGAVSLSILAFLASGEDPNHGPYAKHINRSIDYIIKSQQISTGYIGTCMYNHGFSTLALAEAYGMVQNPRIEQSLRKAVRLILKAQSKNSYGAWRYNPDSSDADTTISGCQIVALLAARNAGIDVPESALYKAFEYLETCRDSSGAYGYTSKNGAKVTLTAIALLCHQLQKKGSSPEMVQSLDFLKNKITYRDPHYTYYFEYYMSQALFQADLDTWEIWNKQNIRLLSSTQQSNGSWLGNRGSSFSTSSALLSLALNFRYLPIYEK